MADRTNITDRQQDQLEESTFEGGIPVFEDQKTRVVAKGAQTGAQRTQNAGTILRRNAGVILPHDDTPNRFAEQTQGKA
jgi:hypothetical protein